MTVFMALDQGTSSSRAILFSQEGKILGVAQNEFPSQFPAEGWVEQDPEAIWQTILDAGRQVLADTGTAAADITAIGITNQRETTLLWERDGGACVYPAIVWQDRRTADVCAAMPDSAHQLVQRQTGLLIDPYFSATKLAWMLNTQPALRARALNGELCAGTVDSFLIHRLTGGQRHVTDATNASRTMLFDIHTQRWSDELLELFAIPRVLLPEVLDCAADFGSTDPAWFGAAIPIAGVVGDQQAALVGQACLEPGMSKCTYGTGLFAMTNTGDRPVISEIACSAPWPTASMVPRPMRWKAACSLPAWR